MTFESLKRYKGEWTEMEAESNKSNKLVCQGQYILIR